MNCSRWSKRRDQYLSDNRKTNDKQNPLIITITMINKILSKRFNCTTTPGRDNRETNDKQKPLYTLTTINNTYLDKENCTTTPDLIPDSVIKLVKMILGIVNLLSGKCVSRC